MRFKADSPGSELRPGVMSFRFVSSLYLQNSTVFNRCEYLHFLINFFGTKTEDSAQDPPVSYLGGFCLGSLINLLGTHSRVGRTCRLLRVEITEIFMCWTPWISFAVIIILNSGTDCYLLH